MKITVTEALKLAAQHIRVGFCGGYVISMPYNGLNDVDGPVSAPRRTYDFRNARRACRRQRITSVIEAVTGDLEYASKAEYDLTDYDDGSDWRKVARAYVNEYKG
jgi:hypothetical protein